MIIRTTTTTDNIPQDEYCNLCMVLRTNIEEDESYVIYTLQSNGMENTSYVPNESFMCISSDREYDINGGVILISNKDLRQADNFTPLYQYDDTQNIQFHYIEAIILDDRLFTKEWLEYAFNTILSNIVNNDEKMAEVIWFDYNNEPYTCLVNKVFDMNGNRFRAESTKLSLYIMNIFDKLKKSVN